MRTQNKKALAVALGGAFAVTLATAPMVHAAENPFAMKTLSSGYMVAEADAADGKMKDGKCSTGKCSSSKKKAAAEEKAKEGNCSADKKKDKEGNCSADKKH